MKKILYYKNFILGIIIIVMVVFVTKDMIAKHKLIMKKLEVKRAELEKGKELIAKWQGVAKEIDTLTRGFFSKDPTLFKTFVEQQAKAANISVNSLSPLNKQKDFYLESTITIKGYSDAYANVAKFIQILESKNINTETLHVKADAKKRNIDIVLKAFIMSE